MKSLMIVVVTASASSFTQAQQSVHNVEKFNYTAPLYTYNRMEKFDQDPAALPTKNPWRTEYAEVTKEITKDEFEYLVKSTTNVNYLTVLKDSKSLEPYGEKGRNGVVLLVLKSKPTFSEEFLSWKRNSTKN